MISIQSHSGWPTLHSPMASNTPHPHSAGPFLFHTEKPGLLRRVLTKSDEGGDSKPTWPFLGEQSPSTLLVRKAAQVFFNFLIVSLRTTSKLQTYLEMGSTRSRKRDPVMLETLQLLVPGCFLYVCGGEMRRGRGWRQAADLRTVTDNGR